MEELTYCRLKTAKRRRKVVVAGREERIGMEGLEVDAKGAKGGRMTVGLALQGSLERPTHRLAARNVCGRKRIDESMI